MGKTFAIDEICFNNSYHARIGIAPYEALYEHKYRPPIHWDEVREKKMLGLEIVQQTSEVIRRIKERLRIVQSRHKSYADNKCKDLEFSIEDMVFHNVTPIKGAMRLANKGKLSPRFVGPFEILERVGVLS